MDSEFLLLLKNLSLEVVIIGAIAFALTMVIKLPIKKLTSNLSDEKRKLANSLIMLIPAILSFVMALLYFGIFIKDWLSSKIIEVALSSWVLSLTIYAIFGRLVIIVKGIFSGRLQVNQNLTKETVDYIKDSIKTALALVKSSEKELETTRQKIKSLSEVKELLSSNEKLLDLTKLSETNIELEKLESQESELCNQIAEETQKIDELKSALYVKEE